MLSKTSRPLSSIRPTRYCFESSRRVCAARLRSESLMSSSAHASASCPANPPRRPQQSWPLDAHVTWIVRVYLAIRIGDNEIGASRLDRVRLSRGRVELRCRSDEVAVTACVRMLSSATVQLDGALSSASAGRREIGRGIARIRARSPTDVMLGMVAAGPAQKSVWASSTAGYDCAGLSWREGRTRGR